MGSRPFNAAEIQSILFATDGNALKVPSGGHKEQGSAGSSGQPTAEKPGGGSR
jgi:hypothetical protein